MIQRVVLGLLLAALCIAASPAAPLSRLQVRVVTGKQGLVAGSSLELRIYESGRSDARRILLVHGEAWLPESTHLIPLRLEEPLDAGNVSRFAIHYRAANALSPPLEIVSADVQLGAGAGGRLLNASLSGIIQREGELASVDASGGTCSSDADCDDHKACNGPERCAPRAAGADPRGCVKGAPIACPVNQICGEGVGCVGVEGLRKFNQPPADHGMP